MDVNKQKKVDKSLTFDERIAFLRHCADLYETNGTSNLSDAEYDKEYYELESINPNDPFFDEVGGLSDSHIYGTRVTHDVIMGSLNKSLSVEEFETWLKATYKDPASFLLQYKIDGLSLSLIYEDGILKRATTRGDGTTGIDVTKNASYVKGVLTKIPEKGKVEVRGECFKDRQDFYKNWHTSVLQGGYKNPRNFASGSLNQIDPKVTEKRGLEFIAYEVVQKDFDTEVDKNRFLVECGFPTLKDSTRRTKEGISFAQVAEAVEKYMHGIKRSELPYAIDGIVVKLNDIKTAKRMGATSGGRKPRASRAVKFPPEEGESVLLAVESNVGRTGALTPVAILKPVDLDGAIITRATLHNYGALVGSNAIRIGAEVIIAKKGDIIPQIIKVKNNGHTAVAIPDVCPCCGETVEWDDNKVELVCNNLNCIAQLNKKIEHWLKKIGVKGIGPGIISKLTDKEVMEWEGRAIVESLPEMYYMLDNDRRSEHPFRKYAMLKEFLGEKTYANILSNIKKVDEITLPNLVEALGIGRVGRTASDIVDIAPTVEEIDRLTVEDVASIDGFATKKAEGFIDGWKTLRPEIKQLLKYVKIKENTVASNKLDGMKFCFTGSFDSPRKELEAKVVNNGGKASSSVGGDTILVWDGEEEGNKYNKALAKGNKIISEKDFLRMLQDC